MGFAADVAFDSKGHLFALDRKQRRIRVFDSTGNPQRHWIYKKSRVLLDPTSLHLTEKAVWVTDAGRHCVWRFDRKTKRATKWGSIGREEGSFQSPMDVVVAGDQVLVVDSGNRRIQVFDRSGKVIRVTGPTGEGWAFALPRSIATDGGARIYVADSGRNRILVFDLDGSFVTQFGDWGFFPGLLDEPCDLAWLGEHLLVLDRRNHRLQAFDGAGESKWLWGIHERTPHEGEGRLHYPNHFAIDPAQKTLVIAEALEDRLQIFQTAPADADRRYDPIRNTGKGRVHFGRTIALAGQLMVVAEPENHMILVYDIRRDIPVNINKFGERGTGFGLMSRTESVDIDPVNRRIRSLDRITRRVQDFRFTYDPEEQLRQRPNMVQFAKAMAFDTLARRAGSDPTATGDFAAIRTAPDGHTFLLDQNRHRILVYDGKWRFQFGFGSYGDKKGRFNRPTDLALDPSRDRTLVVDSLNRRVQVFDRKGTFRFAFGRKHLKAPFGAAVDQDGHIYVSDQALDQVLVFDAKGKYRHRWGERGDEMGQLWNPAGIAVSEDQRVFVIDYGNHRIQSFRTDGFWLATLGSGRAFTYKHPPPKAKNRSSADRR
ncbi:NHL repeat-containing protein [Sulfidibacter corallicola]|uniref:6-bladed beta-propeller n=1 Tax=Sulfidibacter corallicola TaxID=2818388 RepID=A0A8A4TX27_SULCO|nr:NHL repeat-containing protein [Sulfidibacter corallicola]QTD53674.1 6-bladed beta-propeller [Sulfidibacter corallicola]